MSFTSSTRSTAISPCADGAQALAYRLIAKRAIFRKVKESKRLRGDVLMYVAQANVQLDAEIEEKGRFATGC